MTDDFASPVPDEVAPEALPEAPPQPAFDVDAAYRVIAEREGWDPRLTRFQLDEIKQRKSDLDRREREFQERQREIAPSRQEQPMEFGDPGLNQLARMIQEDREDRRREREERRQEQEQQAHVQQLGNQIRGAYESMMTQQGADDSKIQAQAPAFFAALERLYPDGIPPALGPEGAIRNTQAFLKGFGPNGSSYQRYVNPRDPRASIVIPGGSTSATPGAPMPDAGPQRAGETIEQYGQRIEAAGRIMQEQLRSSGLRTLPERYVSG